MHGLMACCPCARRFTLRVPLRPVQAAPAGDIGAAPLARLAVSSDAAAAVSAAPSRAAEAVVAPALPQPSAPPPQLPPGAVQPPPSSAAEKAAMETLLMETLLAHSSNDVFSCHVMRGDALLVEFVSPSVRHVLGWAPEQLVGRDCCRELCHPEDVGRLREALAAVAPPSAAAEGANAGAAAPPACVYGLFRVRTASETEPEAERYLWMHVMLCCDSEGRVLMMGRSAASHKTREEALRGFLLVTSHDLRTPCHGIVVASQLLQSRLSIAADEEAASLVDAVSASCTLMLCVISNVLTMKDVDAGGLAEAARRKLPRTRFEPRALVRAVLATCRLGCGLAAKQLLWRDEAGAASSLPAALEGDAERTTHMVTSMVAYALRHGGAGAPLQLSMTYEAGAGAEEHTTGELVLSLSYDDPLLCSTSEAERERRIFSTDDCASLGLFVARFFARAVGGDVAATTTSAGDGEPGAAAAVTVTLRLRLPVRAVAAAEAAASALAAAPPSAGTKRTAQRTSPSVAAQRVSCASRPITAEAPPLPLPLPPPAARPSVLLVEDNELNLKLVRRLLERHGFEARPPLPLLLPLPAAMLCADNHPSTALPRSAFLSRRPGHHRHGRPGGADQAAGELRRRAGRAAAAVLCADRHVHARHARRRNGAPVQRVVRALRIMCCARLLAEAATAPRRERTTQPAEGRRMYIVALSANALEEHAQSCAAAGIDAFLSKPLRPEAVSQLWHMASAHGGCSAAAAAAAHFASASAPAHT
jgi:signal transduction histidine kinase